jgi:hypothetical protein
VRLLGTFEVLVDGRLVAPGAWPQRRASDLVKLLALSHQHRLPRDQVLEALWPRLAPEAAAANLHKAASYARRALGDRGAVVLRGGLAELAPGAVVRTDVERFEAGDDRPTGATCSPTTPTRPGPPTRAPACATGGSPACAPRSAGTMCCGRTPPTRRRTAR